MQETILFDMDNTLLDDPLDVLGAAFLRELHGRVAHLVPSFEMLVSAFMNADPVIDAYQEGKLTLHELWRSLFFPAVGRSPEELEPLIMNFFAEGFPKLRSVTRRLPAARRVMELAFERGWEVAIATGMYLPRSCLVERLDWAGVPVSDFDYAFLTTWDNMHAGKMTPAYYRELLAHLGKQPDECLMVGDSLAADMAPAIETGIASYWIVQPGKGQTEHNLPVAGQGTLDDFYVWLQQLN